MGDILSRRIMPDTGLDVLNTFHRHGLLRSEPVDNIIMLPRPNMPFPLRQILEGMGKVIKPAEEYDASMIKYNPYETNQGAMKAEQALGIAKNILVEAADLEAIASGKREQAYKLAPELRPASGAPRRAAEKPAVVVPAPEQISLLDMLESTETFVPPKRKGPGRPRKDAA